jgi:hypothetical protein
VSAPAEGPPSPFWWRSMSAARAARRPGRCACGAGPAASAAAAAAPAPAAVAVAAPAAETQAILGQGSGLQLRRGGARASAHARACRRFGSGRAARRVTAGAFVDGSPDLQSLQLRSAKQGPVRGAFHPCGSSAAPDHPWSSTNMLIPTGSSMSSADEVDMILAGPKGGGGEGAYCVAWPPFFCGKVRLNWFLAPLQQWPLRGCCGAAACAQFLRGRVWGDGDAWCQTWPPGGDQRDSSACSTLIRPAHGQARPWSGHGGGRFATLRAF